MIKGRRYVRKLKNRLNKELKRYKRTWGRTNHKKVMRFNGGATPRRPFSLKNANKRE